MLLDPIRRHRKRERPLSQWARARRFEANASALDWWFGGGSSPTRPGLVRSLAKPAGPCSCWHCVHSARPIH